MIDSKKKLFKTYGVIMLVVTGFALIAEAFPYETDNIKESDTSQTEQEFEIIQVSGQFEPVRNIIYESDFTRSIDRFVAFDNVIIKLDNRLSEDQNNYMEVSNRVDGSTFIFIDITDLVLPNTQYLLTFEAEIAEVLPVETNIVVDLVTEVSGNSTEVGLINSEILTRSRQDYQATFSIDRTYSKVFLRIDTSEPLDSKSDFLIDNFTIAQR